MTISSEKKVAFSELKNRLVEFVEADLSEVYSSDEVKRKQLLSALADCAAEVELCSTELGLSGLAAASNILKANFRALQVAPFLSPQLEALVQSWSAPLSAYLHSIGLGVEEDAAVDVIVDFLSDSAWLSPLAQEQEATLRKKFSEPFKDFENDSEAEQGTGARVDATPGSNSESNTEAPESGTSEYPLEFAADVDQGIIDDFVSELTSQVEAFDRAVEQFLITEDEVQLRVAQRVVHTVKGGANLVGLEAIVTLTHELEDAISLVIGDIDLQSKLGPVLQESCDCLSMVSEYFDGLGPEPKNVEQTIGSIRHFLETHLRRATVDELQEDFEEPQDAKIFHLENLIAFNDRGLKKDIPTFDESDIHEHSSDIEKKLMANVINVLSKSREAGGPEISSHKTSDAQDKAQDDISQAPGSDGYSDGENDGESVKAPQSGGDIKSSETTSSDPYPSGESSIESVKEEVNTDDDNGSSMILDIKISEGQKKSLLNFSEKNLRAHRDTAQTFERFLSELSGHTELSAQMNALGLLEHLSNLQQCLGVQGKAGTKIQNLLSDICMSPQNLLTSNCNATYSPELLQALPNQRALVVGVGNSKACLLSEKIKRIVYVDEKCLISTPEGSKYHLAGKSEPIPCASLDELVFPGTDASQKTYPALLVFDVDGAQLYGVLVEAIHENAKQRVKPMGPYDYKSPGVIGSTVLEGGAVSPVIDILALLPELESTE